MADKIFQLVVTEGPEPGAIFVLDADVLVIGRDPGADIVLTDPEISRRHALLALEGERYTLKDMGSTNGTLVDDEPLGIEPVPLKPGQIIKLGTFVALQYRLVPAVDPMETMVTPVFADKTIISEPGSLPSAEVLRNPYVGPRAFEADEREYFYGRDDEIAILEGLVMTRRASLFFAQSGAGKSSLLRAGLIPELTRQIEIGRGRRRRSYQKMNVLPILTVGGAIPGDIQTPIDNVYIFSALFSLYPDAEPDDLAGLSLCEGLADSLPTEAEVEESAASALDPAVPYLLVFDQFEEIFTHYPQRWRDREGFFRQVTEALATYPSLHVVFTMREDFIAELTPYANLIPEGLRPRFRLERLRRDAALSAVTAPAAKGGRGFAEGVAEELVDNLRRAQPGQTGQAGQPAQEAELGAYVEPVHLQIVCRQLWEKLPAGQKVIEAADVHEFGDVDQALTGFYEGTLAKVDEQTAIGNRLVRRWFDEKLITPARTRGLVYRGESETEGLPNEAVDILNNAYIIRASVRGGDVWYELAHDRLVEPILEANRLWRENYANPLANPTRAWLAAGRDQARLLDGVQLEEAQAYADAQPEELLPEEQEFLAESRRQAEFQTEQARLAAQRRRRTITAGVVVIVVLLLAAVFALTQAVRAGREADRAMAQEEIAVTREAEAIAAQAEAEKQAQLAATREAEALANSELAATKEAEALANADRAAAKEAEAIAALEKAALSEASRLIFAARDVLKEDGDQIALLLAIRAKDVLSGTGIIAAGPADRLLLQIATRVSDRSKGRVPLDPCILAPTNLDPKQWENYFSTLPYDPICPGRPVPETAEQRVETDDPYFLLSLCYEGDDSACRQAADAAAVSYDPFLDQDICLASTFDLSVADEVLEACKRAAAYAAPLESASANPFDLSAPTALTFVPTDPDSNEYFVSFVDTGLDNENDFGEELGLGDDDMREIRFQPGFPFLGETINSIWVNSNGNITMKEGDPSPVISADEFTAWLPRIALLYTDLDPGSGGSVYADAREDRLVVTWYEVPLFGSPGTSNTFQAVLHDDGTIDLVYDDVEESAGVVGLAQGNNEPPSNAIDLTADLPAALSAGAIFEEFSVSEADVFLLFEICQGAGVDRSADIPECGRLTEIVQEGDDPYVLAQYCSLRDIEGESGAVFQDACGRAMQLALQADDFFLDLEICRNGDANVNLAESVQQACDRAVAAAAQSDDPYWNFSICQEGVFIRGLADSSLDACKRAVDLAADEEDAVLDRDICLEGDFNVSLKNDVLPACQRAAEEAAAQHDVFLLFDVCFGLSVDRSGLIPECGGRLTEMVQEEDDPYTLASYCSFGDVGGESAAVFREACRRAAVYAAGLESANPFDLSAPTALAFVPTDADSNEYFVSFVDTGLDNENDFGEELGLGDDDVREIRFQPGFPFLGETIDSIWVNSNGNITMKEGDPNPVISADEFTAWLPRIALLHTDLDPGSGGSVYADAREDRLVVTWYEVPLFGSPGTSNTFQAVLHDDGTIDLVYDDVEGSAGIVGLAQGNNELPSNAIDLTADLPAALSAGAIFEEFSVSEADVFLLFDICQGAGVDRSADIPECGRLTEMVQEEDDPYTLASYCSPGAFGGESASIFGEACERAVELAGDTGDPYLYLDICRAVTASTELTEATLTACRLAAETARETDDPSLDLEICRLGSDFLLAESVAPACERLASDATPIPFGSTERGTVEESGAAVYSFIGEEGQTVVISLDEDDGVFDPFLVLLGPDNIYLAEDDDGGGDLNSLIRLTLPESGTYIILAQGLGGQGGAFVLGLEG